MYITYMQVLYSDLHIAYNKLSCRQWISVHHSPSNGPPVAAGLVNWIFSQQSTGSGTKDGTQLYAAHCTLSDGQLYIVSTGKKHALLESLQMFPVGCRYTSLGWSFHQSACTLLQTMLQNHLYTRDTQCHNDIWLQQTISCIAYIGIAVIKRV